MFILQLVSSGSPEQGMCVCGEVRDEGDHGSLFKKNFNPEFSEASNKRVYGSIPNS